MTPVTAIEVLAVRQSVDEDSVDAMLRREAAALGVTVSIRWVQSLDPADLDVRSDGPLVLLTHPDEPDLAWLPADIRRPIIRLDLVLREPDPTPGLFRHIQGRGIDGLRWALRVVHHGTRRPAQRVPYGPHPEQFGELRWPDREPVADAAWPAVVLLHGGFWRSRWELDLMDALAIDLADRGFASWNVEYRRPDRHGWATTVADVTAAIEALPGLAAQFPVDGAAVAVAGHSAGGQLAIQVCADLAERGAATPRLVVSLAGLVQTHRRDIGNGAVPTALGGTPEDIPEVYAAACPLLRRPTELDQLVVVGRQDGPDLQEMSRRYVRAVGPRATLLEEDGDHFSVIDPGYTIWRQTADAIARALTG